MMKYRILNIKNLSQREFETAFSQMSEPRRERCLRYKFIEDRRRMAFGEMLLRNLIAESFEADTCDISVESQSSGQPVAKLKGKELFVSISHSGDFVAAAFSGKPVGIDLEAQRYIKPDFIEKMLSEKELWFVREGKQGELSQDETMRFLQIWTAKEAYIKMTGEGLAGLRKADVLPLIINKSSENLCLEPHHSQDYACTVIFEKIF